MSVCPVCHSEIQITSQHHGTLFTCTTCRAVFFVDWAGQPEVTDLEAATDSEAVIEGLPTFSDVPTYEQPEDSENLAHLETQFAPAPHFETPAQEEEPASEYSEPEENANYDFSQPLSSVDTPMVDPTEPVISNDNSDLSDIAEFGNADLAQSAFNYTVTISGIDSGALRAEIQEAVTDTKFGWNVMQIMAQIKGGVLTIRSMNPVKASILIQRVKYLPVKVSWRQDVLSSSV